MSTPRRTVQKVKIGERTHWEDRPWLVHASLFVLASFLAGVAFASGSLRDVRPWHNPAFWWVIIALATALAVWAVDRIPPHRVRRVTWFTSVASLQVHSVLLVWLAFVTLNQHDVRPRPPMARIAPPQTDVVLTEYAIAPVEPDRSRENVYDRPVEAEVGQDLDAPVDRRSRNTVDITVSAPSEIRIPLPATLPTPRVARTPDPLPRAAAELASAALSRRTGPRSDLPPGQKAAAERERDPDGIATSRDARDPRQRVSSPKVVQPQENSPPAMRPTVSRLADAPATRKLNPQDPVQYLELSRANSAASPILGEKSAVPTEAIASRREDEPLPTRRQKAEQLDLVEPSTMARRSARMPPALQRIPIDTWRMGAGSKASSVSVFASVEMPESVHHRERQLSDVMREATRDAPAGSLDSPRVRRLEVDHAAVPTIDPTQKVTDMPRQALHVGELPVATQDIPRSSLADTPSNAVDPSPELVATALSRSEQGTAGIGRESGFADQELGSQRSAQQATNSAMRPRPVQASARDLAMAPSEPAEVPRSRMGADRAATSLLASPIRDSQHADVPNRRDTSADASAVPQRQSSDATQELVTADRGTATFDTGPPRMASSTHRRQAAGGGGSELANTPLSVARRAPSQGAPSSSSPWAAVSAEPPTAPLAQGGGTPRQESVESAATALTRSTLGSASLAERPTEGILPGQEAAVRSLAPQRSSPRRTATDSDAWSREDYAADARPLERLAWRSAPFRARTKASLVEWSGAEHSHGDRQSTLAAEAPSPWSRGPTGVPIARSDRSADGPLAVDMPAEVGQVHETPSEKASAAGSESDDRTGFDRGPSAVPLEAEQGDGGLDVLAPRLAGLRRLQGTARELGIAPRSLARRQEAVAPRSAEYPSVAIAADAFALRRSRRISGLGAGRPAPLPKTEQSVERGLRFLKRYQAPDGRWSLHAFGQGVEGFDREIPQLRSDTAATGLAVLAFLGAGYHHQADTYREVVDGGLSFLVRNQQASGDLFVPEDELSNRSVALYSHGIAALALAEAYGMTHDPRLKDPAQRAMDFISASQHPRWGGWRYVPGLSADTSVSGWMVLALKSGELGGLEVPRPTFLAIDHWLAAAQASDEQPYLFRYNPYAPNTRSQRHGRKATHSMTSVGLLMHMYRGMQRDNSMLQAGARYLAVHLPAEGTRTNPARDTYYWYYATQVMFHMGDPYWDVWNASLHPLLVEAQLSRGDFAGSWDPIRPVPDRWGAHAGRLYVTTMNLLSLEVYYRHLPIYDQRLRAEPTSRPSE